MTIITYDHVYQYLFLLKQIHKISTLKLLQIKVQNQYAKMAKILKLVQISQAKFVKTHKVLIILSKRR